MFDSKQVSLITLKKASGKTKKTANEFLNNVAKQGAKTLSGNGSLKFQSSGSDWIDQFSSLGKYKVPRSYAEIASDCSKLWAQDKELFVKFTVYLRMISRKTDIFGLGITTQAAQSGAELKHESIMRMVWLSQKSPDAFWGNIGLFISAGSCKDIITMLRQDLVYHGWEGRTLDWGKFGNLILSLLDNQKSTNLMKKYLPQIRTNSSCTTVESQASNLVAKWICSLVFGSKSGSSTYKQYRKLKSSGTAHQWQQLISQRKFDKIDFSQIHGRALNLLVKGKFLHNQNLSDAYSNWIGEQDKVKYTGFVHELLCELSEKNDPNFVKTVDKQFIEAVEKVKGSDENLSSMIVVRDTSGSMWSPAEGSKFSCDAVAKSLALYFSEFLEGAFAGHFIEFSRTATLHEWKGETVSEKWHNDRCSCIGNTNFQSVVDLFCQMKSQGTPESDFPSGILCLSDGEFDPSELGTTNVQAALTKLKRAGFSDEYADSFKIVLWNLTNHFYGRSNKVKFETFGETKNVFYMSGYSASNVKFILNQKVETAEDLFNEAMSQELLDLVEV